MKKLGTAIATACLVIALSAGPAAAWQQAELTPGFPVSLGLNDPIEESSILAMTGETLGVSMEGSILQVGVGDYNAFATVDESGASVQAVGLGGGPNKSSPSLIGFEPITSSSQARIEPPNRPTGIPWFYTGAGTGADVNDQTNGGGVMIGGVFYPDMGNRLDLSISWIRPNQDNYDGIERPGSTGLKAMSGPELEPAFSNGFSEGTYGSMVAADLNGDGNAEVVYGGWDHMIHVRDAETGEYFNSNWPLNVHDACWSTPVVGDIDKDGEVEIVIGYDTTAGIFDHANGGRMTMLDQNGNVKHNWPYQIDQTFYSSPAVGDINGDGIYEIVSGTGSYWTNADGSLRGAHVYCWDPYGTLRWRSDIGGVATSSPALADIDGDGKLETIIGAWDGKVYCLDENGYHQWSTMLVDRDGNSFETMGKTAAVKSSPTVADIDGDGDLEILIGWLWEVIILDHNGNQLTGPGSPDNTVYLAYWSLFSSPTVEDIDGDGYYEIVIGGGGAGSQVVQDSAIWSWETNSPVGSPRPWWTFHKDAQRSGWVR